MANKKISQLTAKGTALAATDLVEIAEDDGVGGYVTKSVTGANIVSGLQPTLVSGTDIVTINSQTLLQSGDLELQAPLVSGTDIVTINTTSLLGSGNVNLQTPLVSGTDIKTVNSTTLLGSGDIAVQPTLVSGTSIKTINSTTLLGSGNVAVQPTLVSGTSIKTINSTTLLGSGDIVLGSGVHVLTKPVTGRLYNVRTNGTAVNTATSTVANTISLYPFIPANSLTISNLQITVSTGTVGGLIRLLVYSDSNGVPGTKLIESTSLDTTSAAIKTYTTSYTFTAGTVYWLGYYSNLAIPVNVYDAAQMTPISASTHFSAFTNVTAAATFPTAPSPLGTATPVSSTGSNLGVINLTAA